MAVGPYARQLMASRCLRIVEAGALEIKMIPVLASFYPHPMLDIEKVGQPWQSNAVQLLHNITRNDTTQCHDIGGSCRCTPFSVLLRR